MRPSSDHQRPHGILAHVKMSPPRRVFGAPDTLNGSGRRYLPTATSIPSALSPSAFILISLTVQPQPEAQILPHAATANASDV
ncbi:unnamed protein product [Acanthoscelides obtectus]|uniref:Uncharacterized protein n=1 Tax=Acanthoscelides obtectus TaxID=200917 RepID=A0A9P0NWH6_ACAOB|nr:unnamed protein product [Acanthoscelides obtectus]CAK1628907.1 hypothetical protein AOBTE_LOCUS5460 [Acanthoscelides obtectus]